MKLLFSDEPIIKMPQKSIFLAGPTSRENDFDKSWRKEAVEIFEKLKFDGVVCIPEFKNKRPFTDNDWERQVDWEWTLLDNASCIMFWIPREKEKMPGLTTNLEFGTYFERCPEKVVLGYPPEAESMKWLEVKYKKVLEEEPQYTLCETIKKSIEVTNTMTSIQNPWTRAQEKETCSGKCQ